MEIFDDRGLEEVGGVLRLSRSIPYKKTEAYEIRLEPIEDRLFVHLTIDKWSSKVKRELTSALNNFNYTLYSHVHDSKMGKFNRLMGFVDTGARVDGFDVVTNKPLDLKLFKREV